MSYSLNFAGEDTFKSNVPTFAEAVMIATSYLCALTYTLDQMELYRGEGSVNHIHAFGGSADNSHMVMIYGKEE